MKPYRAMLAARFRLLLQYRAAALAGVATQVFFGVVIAAVMRAFYASADTPAPLSLPATLSYIWLSQAFFSLLPWRGDPDIVALVRNGGVAYELLRPTNVFMLWFARAVALRTAPVLLRAIPMLLLARWLFDLAPPASPTAAGLWLLGVAGAVALSASITVLLNLSLLWTISGEGLTTLTPVVVAAASGLLLPLPLFPNWLQAVLHWLPFRGLMDVPHRLYLGELSGGAAGWALLQQWAWTGVLVLAGLTALQRGLNRLVVQGG